MLQNELHNLWMLNKPIITHLKLLSEKQGTRILNSLNIFAIPDAEKLVHFNSSSLAQMGLAVIGTAATAITNALHGLHATLVARLAGPGPDDMACLDHTFMMACWAIQVIFRK